jgi:hypothetical protein
MGDGVLGIGDGDGAKSPIPNPQSPIPNPQSPIFFSLSFLLIIFYLKNKKLKIY